MNRKSLGVLLAVLGAALAVVSALADSLDIGMTGFGWKQVTGVSGGVVVVLVGGFLAFRTPRSSAS